MWGAAVGDVLEVRIRDIELRQNWGYNLFRVYGGTFPDDFPYYRLIHVALDRKSNMAVMASGLKVPMRPFFGQLAVAPRKDVGRQNARNRASSAAISTARSLSRAARFICRYGTKGVCSRRAMAMLHKVTER